MKTLTLSPEDLRSKFYVVPDIDMGIDINEVIQPQERESVMAKSKRVATVANLAVSRQDVLGRDIRETKVDDLKVGGKPGTIYYKPLSVRTVLDFMSIEDGRQRIEKTVTLLASSWVDANGKAMFTEDELYDKVAVGVLTSVMNAIVGGSSAKNA